MKIRSLAIDPRNLEIVINRFNMSENVFTTWASADPLASYALECQAVAKRYVERSTRFGECNLQFGAIEARSIAVRILNSTTLEVDSSSTEVPGTAEALPADDSTRDWALYQNWVAEQAAAELGRRETREEIIADLNDRPYADLRERRHVRTHPRRLLHPHTCDGCSGVGKVDCSSCSGRGCRTCFSCGASGRNRCSSCGGSGRVTYTEPVRDRNGYFHNETKHRQCHSCAGGYVTCSGCGGSGTISCGTCGATGEVTCGPCCGHGSLTLITTTHTYATPSFSVEPPAMENELVRGAVERLGLFNFAEHGRVDLIRSDEWPDPARVEIEYRCSLPVCEMSVIAAGADTHWLVVGEQFKIDDAGGVVEVLLKCDHEDLVRLSRERARWHPRFQQRAETVLQQFMASEIHQHIVSHAADRMDESEIKEKIHRSVSVAYIVESLSALQSIGRPIALWTRLRCAAASLLLTLLTPLLVSIAALPDDAFASVWMRNEGADFMKLAAVASVACSLVFLCGRWVHVRWLRKVGGKPITSWARSRRLMPGVRSALLATVACTLCTGVLYERFLVSLDDLLGRTENASEMAKL